MALSEYKPGSAFSDIVGRTSDVSHAAQQEPVRAREGAPNVLFIVLEETLAKQIERGGVPPGTVTPPPTRTVAWWNEMDGMQGVGSLTALLDVGPVTARGEWNGRPTWDGAERHRSD